MQFRNRYFVESPHPDILTELLEDDTIGHARVDGTGSGRARGIKGRVELPLNLRATLLPNWRAKRGVVRFLAAASRLRIDMCFTWGPY